MENFLSRRVKIITGHYGSGKTEIALNMALSLIKDSPRPVTLADMDIINPYFRSREKKELLEKEGITIIGGSIEDSLTGVPALSGAVKGKMNVSNDYLILDAGGDPEGARLLGRYPDEFARLRKEGELEHLFVINSFRPETPDADRALAILRMIEDFSGVGADGIISNGHLLKATGPEEIRAGWKAAKELSEMTGLPLRGCTFPAGTEPPAGIPRDLLIPLTLHHRQDWMS